MSIATDDYQPRIEKLTSGQPIAESDCGVEALNSFWAIVRFNNRWRTEAARCRGWFTIDTPGTDASLYSSDKFWSIPTIHPSSSGETPSFPAELQGLRLARSYGDT
jgi:hypothetical protein